MTEKITPRLEPEPGRPFINRDAELEFIAEKLKIGMDGLPMPSVVVCIWGAYGMGKSWLLREVERKYRFAGENYSVSYPCVTARLDLNKNSPLCKDSQLNKELLVREIWRQIDEQINTGMALSQKISADALAKSFIDTITKVAAQSYTPLIMLDTLDDLIEIDEPAFDWIETHIIEPLALTDRVLFICTSRGEIRHWRKFQVKRRADARRLGPFNVDLVMKQFEANAVVAQFIHKNSFGHPLFADCIGTQLEKEKIKLNSAQADELPGNFTEHKEILHSVINNVLSVSSLNSHPLLPEITRYVSILRWLSTESLIQILGRLALTSDKNEIWYQNTVIDNLQISHVLHWNFDRNCYEPDLTLRKLFTYDLWLSDPQKFQKVNVECIKFYQNHLEKHPQYLGKYLPEFLYHTFLPHSLDSSTEVKPNDFAGWWGKFVQQIPTEASPWEELIQALAQDTELQHVVPEQSWITLNNEAKQHILDLQ